MKYYTTAKALRLASLNSVTMSAYRAMGNLKNFIKPTRQIAHKYYFRTEKFLSLLARNEVLRPDMKVLEMGTGWVHWEAMILRNQIPCEITLYDVWDNRSPRRFKAYVERLRDPAERARLGLDNPASADLMAKVAAAPSLDAAYQLLGFDYVLDPRGLMAPIKENSRDLIVSSDVGEHLNAEDIPAILKRSFEVLKPGGWAYHQVVMTDHLRIYAKDAHPKQYLMFDDATFEGKINNKVQYINRVQIPDWLRMFEDAGFDVVVTDRIASCDLSQIDVHPMWKDVPEEDLACTIVQFLLRKPEAAASATVAAE